MRERNRLAGRIEGVRDAGARGGRRDGTDRAGRGRGRRRHGGRRRSPPCARWPRRPSGGRSKACCPARPTATTAYVEINAGAGGTEAQDWARDADAHVHALGRAARLQGAAAGGERGRAGRHQIRRRCRSAGPNAYGWLKTEAGVHRLVRISPFDAAARRQTSFASVWVYPVVDDTIEIEIDRGRPEGGHVPRLRRRRPARQQDRKRHPHHPHADRHHRGLPDRPQPAPQPRHRDGDAEGAACTRRNCSGARRRRRAQEAAKTDIGWGHQIRSYVLAPYQLVKDLRTGVEKGNPDAVLDGDAGRVHGGGAGGAGRARRAARRARRRSSRGVAPDPTRGLCPLDPHQGQSPWNPVLSHGFQGATAPWRVQGRALAFLA